MFFLLRLIPTQLLQRGLDARLYPEADVKNKPTALRRGTPSPAKRRRLEECLQWAAAVWRPLVPDAWEWQR